MVCHGLWPHARTAKVLNRTPQEELSGALCLGRFFVPVPCVTESYSACVVSRRRGNCACCRCCLQVPKTLVHSGWLWKVMAMAGGGAAAEGLGSPEGTPLPSQLPDQPAEEHSSSSKSFYRAALHQSQRNVSHQKPLLLFAGVSTVTKTTPQPGGRADVQGPHAGLARNLKDRPGPR